MAKERVSRGQRDRDSKGVVKERVRRKKRYGEKKGTAKKKVWQKKRYGKKKGMEKKKVWRKKRYGEKKGMAKKRVWRKKGYGEKSSGPQTGELGYGEKHHNTAKARRRKLANWSWTQGPPFSYAPQTRKLASLPPHPGRVVARLVSFDLPKSPPPTGESASQCGDRPIRPAVVHHRPPPSARRCRTR